jgi:hypothetical protein
MIPDELVEKIARAMCEEMGHPEDGEPYDWNGQRFHAGPTWECYVDHARKAIAFQRAWERVKGDQ